MRPPDGVGSRTSDVRSYLLAVSPTDQEDGSVQPEVPDVSVSPSAQIVLKSVYCAEKRINSCF